MRKKRHANRDKSTPLAQPSRTDYTGYNAGPRLNSTRDVNDLNNPNTPREGNHDNNYNPRH